MPHSIVNLGHTPPQPSPKGREQFPSFGGVRGGSNSLIIKHLPPPPPPPQLSDYQHFTCKSLVVNQLRVFLNTEFTENHRVTQRKYTSPNPSPLNPPQGGKGGEQATIRLVQIRKVFEPSLFPPFGGTKGGFFSVRKQLPLFWRGLGGGLSGLPHPSCLTARNDGKHKHTLRRAIPYANELWAFNPKNKAESLTSTAWGNALRNDSPLSFGEGGGRGDSGLPRRSCLTARNDGVVGNNPYRLSKF